MSGMDKSLDEMIEAERPARGGGGGGGGGGGRGGWSGDGFGGGRGRGGGGRGGPKPPPRGKPPDDYVCRLCGVPGHWIQVCPTIPPEQRAPEHVTAQTRAMRENTAVSTDANGDKVVTLYETEVVRISGSTITLNTGGYFTQGTRECMCEALSPFGFAIKEPTGADKKAWQISGNMQLVRFYDGVQLFGAHLVQPADPGGKGKGGRGGPMPSGRGRGGGGRSMSMRFAPY